MRLTLPQQDIYYEQLLYPNDPIYNIGAKIEIKGPINYEVLNEAYKALIDQHDAYRSQIVKDGEGIRINISSKHETELGYLDFSQEKFPEKLANNYMESLFLSPIKLEPKKLLHTFILIKVSDSFYFIFSKYHHIITDGWGTSLMFQRWVKNYNEILEFGSIQTEYPYSYQDFVEYDKEYEHSDDFAKDRLYWKDKFAHIPERLFANVKNAKHINQSRRKELIIKRSIYNHLEDTAKASRASVFHIILGTLFLYFGRITQNQDFAIGLPVLNRGKFVFKKTVGLFMGISPLRIQLDFDESFKDLVANIRNQLRQDYRHQRFPIGRLIKDLELFHDKGRLFNITLSYEKQDYADNFKDTKTKVIPLTHQAERVALAIYIREFDELEDVKIDFDYNVNYFSHESIKQVVLHFEKLLYEIVISPHNKLSSYRYITNEEETILHSFNKTNYDFPRNSNFLTFFDNQAKIKPREIAVFDNDKTYTYEKLLKLSDSIASYLTSTFKNKKPFPIAVLMQRSSDLVAILLGILKTGCSYIPLDPEFPKERLRYILKHSNADCLITTKELRKKLVEEAFWIDSELLVNLKEYKYEKYCSNIVSTNVAYIIYTSGSTGKPKGVAISHKSLLNFLLSMQREPKITEQDTLFSVTTQSFDISLLEFFAPLISGATIYIAKNKVLRNTFNIIKELKKIEPTMIQATPSFYQMLFNAGWEGNPSLKILVGGDLLSERLAKILIRTCGVVWNMYGPTETTIWSSIKKLNDSNQSSNIGKPINNTKFYILDNNLKLLPIGSIGTIYIGGDGLAEGYYRNLSMTNEKFIANPFKANEKIYNTGDLGKWTLEGEIEFFGRQDNQVKIRGYRIELGDIESQLNRIEGIKDSVVVSKKEGDTEAILVAYVISDTKNINIDFIIKELKLSLPHYMIPYTIIPLESFPVTPNQKVDRKSLGQKKVERNNLRNLEPPVSEFEKILVKFWKNTLEIDTQISINDNFFSLGGQSLDAVKIIGLIAKKLSLHISFKAFFDFPSIKLLAKHLEGLKPHSMDSIAQSKRKNYYPLTPAQYNIWLYSQQREGSIAYNMVAAYKVQGNLNPDRISTSINKIINRHEILRTNFIEKDGKSYQKISGPNEIDFSLSQISSKATDKKDIINRLANTEFNLKKDLLIRLYLLKFDSGEYFLLFSTHHIIMDGLSLEIFIKEFIEDYNYPSSPNKTKEQGLKIQFKDYAEWTNKKIERNTLVNKSFWSKYLENYKFSGFFNTNSLSIGSLTKGGKHVFEIAEDTTSDLKKLAVFERVPFYTILVAGLNILINRLSNNEDICIATIDSGRSFPELNDLIGMFAKTLVLRTQIKAEQSFTEIVQNVQNNILKIDDYKDIPYDIIPLSKIEILLVYQNPDFSFEIIKEITDLQLTHYPVENYYSRVPLTFNLLEMDRKLRCSIEFNSDILGPQEIKLIASQFGKLFIEITKNPLLKVSQVDNIFKTKQKNTFHFDF